MNLEKHLQLNEQATKEVNLCDRFSERDLSTISTAVWEGFDRDRQSRFKWERRTEAGMNLALQIVEAKNFPWPNCSNVKFPLITVGAMQYHAMAYPVLVMPPDVVQYRVIGDDPKGEKKNRADRIGAHMSYQRLEEDKEWEPQHSKLILNNCIVGTTFKKSYYSPKHGFPVSELVLARDLVLDYYSPSVETSPRKTQIIQKFRNDLYENSLAGVYRDIRDTDWFKGVAQPLAPTHQDAKRDNRQGVSIPQPDETTPFTILEQHCLLDLDGDGYAEPYIITFESASHELLRIVTRFEWGDVDRIRSEILRIRPFEYFTKYGFIPSPDGGIYDIGFGVLLGPLNESVNSAINQLLDAGTMSNTAGGFLGRGAKIRGGVHQFSPFTWTHVDGTGDDINKNMVPLPVREPSAVLFNLLGLLIEYSNRVSGAHDATVGENPGQNTPAETHRRMAEMGQKIYNATFKTHWQCMKEEFRKLYVLNALYMPLKKNFGSRQGWVQREDYLGDPSEVCPVADPNVTSDQMRLMQASSLKQNAMVTQGYNLYEVEKRWLKALRVDGIDVIYPGPGKVPPLPNYKVMVEQLKQQPKMLQLQLDRQQFLVQIMEDRKVNQAKILQLEAQAAKLLADAKGVQSGQQLEAFKSQLEVLKGKDEIYKSHMDVLMKQMELEAQKAEGTDGQGAGQGGMGQLGSPAALPSPQGAATPAPGTP